MSRRSARVCNLHNEAGELVLELTNVHPEELGTPIREAWVVNGGWKLRRATDGVDYEAVGGRGDVRNTAIDLSYFTIHDDGYLEPDKPLPEDWEDDDIAF